MRFILLGLLLIIFSCGNEKTIQLPEINHSEITEINDVSAAYLFYDETKKDSVELNRKNLISTTNWLVNVDKRLTLKQVIPHIKFLQDKKKNSSHKNENAKNYFTCNDTSRSNLGFIEFTDVVYHEGFSFNYLSKTSHIPTTKRVNIICSSSEKIEIHFFIDNITSITTSETELLNTIKQILKDINEEVEIILEFRETSTFQTYIKVKSQLSKIPTESISILKDEFIYN
ncbi:hypothetical protein SAMN05428642_102703 [Flaviramulus basaltis]|uniref:Lipoprotein n=1 Tax=Flaviramulus basaltis TaxID=369401 RepID=A0A1K2IJF0_9FLAO|nr:hypothetical protein [Flaviramulus basaltis]SFZ92402.1 hypothetical protein SAMN05428642_102703 [Flaviramulus basaltis]